MKELTFYRRGLASLGLALAWICTGPAIVNAEPLNLKQVAAEAQWIAHIDVDAIKNSTVVQRAYDVCMTECDKARNHLTAVREKIGLDLTEDLQSVTFYGKQIKIGVGVAIVHASIDQAALEEKVQRARDYQTTQHGSYTLHQWMHTKGKHEHQVTGCFHSPTTIVFGRSPEDVTAALDVLDGKADCLEGIDSPLAVAVPNGTMLTVKACRLDNVELPSRSPLIKLGKSFSLLLGEFEGASFASVTLTTKSEEMATQVMQMLEGFHAMARIQHEDKPLVQEILGAVKASATEDTVTVELHASADEVWERAKILRKRIEKNGCPLKR